MEEKKKCKNCNEIKKLDNFWYKDKKTGRRNTTCKQCLYKIVKNKNCNSCNKEYKPYTTLSKFCSTNCRVNNMKSKRSSNWNDEQVKNITGNKNPAYRNGMYCKSTKKNSSGEKEFLRNSKSIKKQIIDDFGYIHCQDCKVNNSLRFETHHIIFRSEKPLHENLHKKENLIVLCISCHNKYHKNKGKRNELVEKRELNLLFGNDVLNK
tara:strand:+ start:1519 stop:2142 length:624 start_codon:yes stop_codon:yes gene_type:complete